MCRRFCAKIKSLRDCWASHSRDIISETDIYIYIHITFALKSKSDMHVQTTFLLGNMLVVQEHTNTTGRTVDKVIAKNEKISALRKTVPGHLPANEYGKVNVTLK